MNVQQIEVVDLDLDDDLVTSIGQVVLSLVIANSYLKSCNDFTGIELNDDDLSAIGSAALNSALAAHQQLHEVVWTIREIGLDEWIADTLSDLIGDVCSSTENFAQDLAMTKLRTLEPHSLVTDEEIDQFLSRPISDADKKVVKVKVTKGDQKVVKVQVNRGDEDN